MVRASSAALDSLHALAATALAEELSRALEASRQPKTIQVEEAGISVTQNNPAYSALNPQLIDKVLKFLKDNGIDSPAKNAAVGALADVLAGAEVDLDGAAMATRQ